MAVLASPTLADSYVVCDNGLRCIMAPCPSHNALNISTGETSRVTDIKMERVAPGDLDKITDVDATYEGTLVLNGRIHQRQVKRGKVTRPATVLVVRGVERKSNSNERRQCRSG